MIDPLQLAAVKDLPTHKVETPEWEPKFPHVFVRMMGTEERIGLSEFNQDKDGKESEALEDAFIYRFAALVLCQEDGTRLFGDDNLDALKAKNPEVLKRIGLEARAHNGIAEHSQKEAVENSEADTDSTSDT